MVFRAFLTRHSLVAGIVLMFLYTWTIDLANAGVLPFKVPFAVALTVGWGFIIVSLLMTWLALGGPAAVALGKRLFQWRVEWRWYLIAILLLPALQIASVGLTSLLAGSPKDFSRPPVAGLAPQAVPLLALVLPWFLFELLTNGEEMGWRGYILPRLQARHSALIASLITGALWGAWHLPKFLGSGANSDHSFAWFALAHLALGVLYTWLYNNTGGSLLLTSMFHAAGNTAAMFLPVSFAAPGGLDANILVALYVLAAVAVTLGTGAERLSRSQPKQVQV